MAFKISKKLDKDMNREAYIYITQDSLALNISHHKDILKKVFTR